MANPPDTNPEKYFRRNAFERLMMLIATLVRVPGVGYLDREETDSGQHSALEEVYRYVLETAEQQGITLDRCTTHSLHKDLKTLRNYGILDSRMYRWGYFLGTGALNQLDMAIVLNVLHSQAKYQRDPQVKHLYERLAKRLKGATEKEALFYPVRAQWNRSIVETDPVERMSRGSGPRSLLDDLEVVEDAILNGHALELRRRANPFGDTTSTQFQAWPLQILHYDVAWYLIYQYCSDKHLAVSRIDRLSDDYRVLTDRTRSLDEQRRNLKLAHELLEDGWGLLLGKPEDQRLEIQGKLELTEVRVRFYPKVMEFIAEGALRHPTQKIEEGPLDPSTRKPAYLDYVVALPKRSIPEFSFWVYRFMGNAQVVSPDWLVKEHLEAATQQVAYYTCTEEI